MNIFNWLRPAAFPEKIQNDEIVKKQYKYWRIRTFYGMYIGYAFYYFSRKSLTFAMPSMLNEGYSLSELGMLGSILSLTYGFSKFLSGIIGDRSNPRYFMSFGLIFTGICNICFGFFSLWALFALFWGLNAWFQGWGWPGCAKLLTHWYSQSERGRWWSIWNTSHNLGGALIPLIAAFCAYHFGWRFAMFVPGALCILTGFFLINRLRDVPESLGLPPIEKFKDEKNASDQGEKKISLSVKEILFKYVLCNEYIWLLAFAYFFVYIIRIGFNDWSMVYLIKLKGYSEMKAASCVLCFEIGGFLGSLCAGWASDLFFASKRNPINFIFTAGTLCSLMTLYCNELNLYVFDAIIIFFVGFFIFGPQMLIGMAAAELTHKGAAATSSGFAGCFAYIGAAVAGGPLGYIIHAWGWDIYFSIMFGCSLAALALLLPLWSIKSISQSLLSHPLEENKEEVISKILEEKGTSTDDPS
jgi:OPA family sugar phosphate sensor protein UhpC-like MFS transporter